MSTDNNSKLVEAREKLMDSLRLIYEASHESELVASLGITQTLTCVISYLDHAIADTPGQSTSTQDTVSCDE